MRPADFKGVTHYLGAPDDWDEEQFGPCSVLPLMKDGPVWTSVWLLDWKDRLKLLFGGDIALHVVSGNSFPPVKVEVNR